MSVVSCSYLLTLLNYIGCPLCHYIKLEPITFVRIQPSKFLCSIGYEFFSIVMVIVIWKALHTKIHFKFKFVFKDYLIQTNNVKIM